MVKEFKGVMPPIITPFKSNYEVDEEGLKQLINFLVDGGVHGVIPTGSTGEFARMSVEERKKVIKVSVDAASGKTVVIAGTAGAGTLEAIELSKYAQNIGADGLQIVAPYYGHFSNDEIYAHYKAIAEAVNIPIFIYNNPWTSGNDVLPPLLAKLNEIPNIIGVKEASGDSNRVARILALTGGRMTVFAGTDNNTLEGLVLGATGWVAGLANFIPKQCVEFFNLAVEKGDLGAAKDYWLNHIYPVGNVVEGSKFVQYIKYACEQIGLKAGPTRPPLLPLIEEEKVGFKSFLQKCQLL